MLLSRGTWKDRVRTKDPKDVWRDRDDNLSGSGLGNELGRRALENGYKGSCSRVGELARASAG